MKANDVAKSEPLGFSNSKKDELNILLNNENGTESLSEDVLLNLSRNFVTLTSEAGEVDSYDASRYAHCPRITRIFTDATVGG